MFIDRSIFVTITVCFGLDGTEDYLSEKGYIVEYPK